MRKLRPSMSEAYSEANHQRWTKVAAEYVESLVEQTRHQPMPALSDPKDPNWVRVDEAVMRVLKALKNKDGCPEALMYLEYAMEGVRARVAGVHDARVSIEDAVVQTLFLRIGETGMISCLWKAHKDGRDPFEMTGHTPQAALDVEDKLAIPHDARHAEKADRLFMALRARRLTK